MAAASIASGSPARAFGSALATPCSDFSLRRAGAVDADFAGFGAEGMAGAMLTRSGCVSAAFCAATATPASRAAFSIVAGDICTTAVAGAGAGDLSIWPRK
jgi:hypothetical protein